MIYLDGGSRATQAMMSGDLPIAQVGGNAPVVAKLRGADVTLISGLLNVLAYSMVVSPEIKRPEDLRGKKLTVSRFGSNSDYATRKDTSQMGPASPTSTWRFCRYPEGSLPDSRQFNPSRCTAWSRNRRSLTWLVSSI